MQKFAMFLFVAIEFMMIHMFENEPFCIFVFLLTYSAKPWDCKRQARPRPHCTDLQ